MGGIVTNKYVIVGLRFTETFFRLQKNIKMADKIDLKTVTADVVVHAEYSPNGDHTDEHKVDDGTGKDLVTGMKLRSIKI